MSHSGGGDKGRTSPSSGERGGMSLDHPSSDVGSEYDDVDYADEHESEGGDVNFAGVTSDLKVKWPNVGREGCNRVWRYVAKVDGVFM